MTAFEKEPKIPTHSSDTFATFIEVLTHSSPGTLNRLVPSNDQTSKETEFVHGCTSISRHNFIVLVICHTGFIAKRRKFLKLKCSHAKKARKTQAQNTS